MRHRVAVTGMGVVCAIGRTVAEFRAALFAGRSGIRSHHASSIPATLPTRIAAEVKSDGPLMRDRKVSFACDRRGAGDGRRDARGRTSDRTRRPQSRPRPRAVLHGRSGRAAAPARRCRDAARRPHAVSADAVRPLRADAGAAVRALRAAVDPRLGLRRRHRRDRQRISPDRLRPPALDDGGRHRLDDQPARRRRLLQHRRDHDRRTTIRRRASRPFDRPPRRLRPGRRRRRCSCSNGSTTRRGAARRSTPRSAATAPRSTRTASASRIPKDAARCRRWPAPLRTRASMRRDLDCVNAHGTAHAEERSGRDARASSDCSARARTRYRSAPRSR